MGLFTWGKKEETKVNLQDIAATEVKLSLQINTYQPTQDEFNSAINTEVRRIIKGKVCEELVRACYSSEQVEDTVKAMNHYQKDKKPKQEISQSDVLEKFPQAQFHRTLNHKKENLIGFIRNSTLFLGLEFSEERLETRITDQIMEGVEL